MDKLVQEALDAIGYANYPTDSVLGALRAKNGHPKPFHLKYVEIGSENYGHEYTSAPAAAPSICTMTSWAAPANTSIEVI